MYSARMNNFFFYFSNNVYNNFTPFKGIIIYKRGKRYIICTRGRGALTSIEEGSLTGSTETKSTPGASSISSTSFESSPYSSSTSPVRATADPSFGSTTLLPHHTSKIDPKKIDAKVLPLIKKRIDHQKRIAYSTTVLRANSFNSALASSFTAASLSGSLTLHSFS